MSQNLQTFLINIAVIEGRHYIWPNTNSAVLVTIDNQKKCTAVKFNSDSPYYNEYFVFEFSTTFENIIDKNVVITVFKPGSVLLKRKILGTVSFDVGTVWYHKDHQIYHKWAILTAPSKGSGGGARGYLKLDVTVLSRGEVPKIPPFVNTNEIEGNLFLPTGTATERQRINFIFDVYRAVDFVKKNPTQESTKKTENLPTTQIGISFSGCTVKTTTKKSSSTPIWNERLIVPEFFPPLCQRFRVELYHDSTRRAVRYLSLRTVSSDNADGFLPTFGPSFIHFYSPNNLEGYLGKVLISLQTSLLGDLEVKTDIVKSKVPPLREEYLLQYEHVVIFAAIFEVSSIVKKFSDKPISFRLSCGPNQMDESGDKIMTAVAPLTKPRPINKNYSFLPIDGTKPCLHLMLTLPDVRRRIYNYNILTKISRELKTKLQSIEDIFLNKDYKTAVTETEPLLLETIDFVFSAAGKYIDIVSNYNLSGDPLLDQERLKMYLREMNSVMMKSKEILDNQSKRKMLQKLEKLQTNIETLIDIIEDWPQIYLWMIYGGKRVAYCIIQPREVIHSPVEEEKGFFCGVLRTIYFQTETNQNTIESISSVCNLDVMLWMGLPRHLNTFLPSGFSFSPEPIPRNLIAEENHAFQAKVHIFQGQIDPGWDKSGLCDPFIHVIIGSQFRQSEVLKKTLTPVWDQTLTFQKIMLYGSIDFIINNPPIVCFHIYDQDEFYKSEPVGKCFVKPFVRTLRDSSNLTPKLSWHKIHSNFDISAEILTTTELIELTDGYVDTPIDNSIVKIPPEIKPNLSNYRIEVAFWGVRHLKKVQMSQITKPRIIIECGTSSLSSDNLINAKKNLNFMNHVKMFETIFPEQEEFAPPLFLKMFDCRTFGINVLAGVHVTSVERFLYKPSTAEEREAKLMSIQRSSLEYTPSIEAIIKKIEEREDVKGKTKHGVKAKLQNLFKSSKKEETNLQSLKVFNKVDPKKELEDSSDFDWWTKFYASLEETSNPDAPLSHKHKLKIYPNELENQPEFDGFTDILTPFSMYKGKRTGDEAIDEENTTGVFKGSLRIYKWPLSGNYVTPRGLQLEQGIFQDFPSNNPVEYVLRVYCIRGLNLSPKDLSGKSDPYLRISLNKQVINDRENRIMGQLNPVFGRCFEMKGTFPADHTLIVTVMDYDATTGDDLIGHTKIDLENRFYTKHRAHCGLAESYFSSGYCQWRDQQKPTTILENLCKRYYISDLHYEPTFVRVAYRDFSPKNFTPSNDTESERQTLALEVLNRWSEIPVLGCSLVPEHVETRSLYNPEKPGIEQGKLQMWIDILPILDLPAPKQVNIKPRKPREYQLRVIVWNASNVKLEETDIITGQKKSDIFIKGWVISPETAQYTDIHYRSLSGEANFNWRFIFPFSYLPSENRIVISRKLWSGSEEKIKLPCRLTLQTWDNDTISYDDFLGVVTMELSRLPKGAPTAQTCTLSLLKNSNPTLNLFKKGRTKGWWPLKSFDPKIQKEIFAGSLELEFELMTKEDAEKCPAGLGRDDPQGLPKPNRPDTSFSFFKNPLKVFKYSFLQMRRKCIKLVLFVLLVVIIFVVCYHIPQLGLKEIVKI